MAIEMQPRINTPFVQVKSCQVSTPTQCFDNSAKIHTSTAPGSALLYALYVDRSRDQDSVVSEQPTNGTITKTQYPTRIALLL